MYTRAELVAMHIVCQKYGLPLYVDGARLGYALATPENDMTLANLAELADLFYIGGTKCGAMFGEALVIANPAYQKDFRYMIKQRGASLAKGAAVGHPIRHAVRGKPLCGHLPPGGGTGGGASGGVPRGGYPALWAVADESGVSRS
ncbi:MAG: beta-eliminating lyase-related protein [Christensenellaceae bacterium]